MRRDNFTPTKYSNLCSQHFTQDCFKRQCNNRVLKEHAVPSMFSSSLHVKAESLEPFTPELLFSLPLTPDPVTQGEESESHEQTATVSCDHNYTAEDSAQQKRRVEQLEEQVEHLRRRLKSSQQRCRRQERQLQRLRAALGLKSVSLGEAQH